MGLVVQGPKAFLCFHASDRLLPSSQLCLGACWGPAQQVAPAPTLVPPAPPSPRGLLVSSSYCCCYCCYYYCYCSSSSSSSCCCCCCCCCGCCCCCRCRCRCRGHLHSYPVPPRTATPTHRSQKYCPIGCPCQKLNTYEISSPNSGARISLIINMERAAMLVLFSHLKITEKPYLFLGSNPKSKPQTPNSVKIPLPKGSMYPIIRYLGSG